MELPAEGGAAPDRLAGQVEAFEAGRLSGWVLDRARPRSPCEIEVYVNSARLGTFRADRERPDLAAIAPDSQHLGFLVELGDRVGPGERVEVYVAGTNIRLPAGPQAAALGGEPIDEAALARLAHSPFIPVPEPAFITYISGQTEGDLAETYLYVGAVIAADVYNTVLAAGRDLAAAGFHLADLGCGCGRIASFLAPLLHHGRYSGLDIWTAGLDWARRHISAAAPHLCFTDLATENLAYQGRRHFPIPLAAQSVDALIATSLFTHLDEPSVLGYLAEIGRVLKPGGVLYLTCFFREPEEMAELRRAQGANLVEEAGVSWLGFGGYLDSRIDSGFLTAAIERHGMAVCRLRKGFWRGQQHRTINAAAFQDLVVARRL